MTITTFTTATVHGLESDVEYDRLEDAVAVAQQRGLQVIARYYEFADSELLEDFTQYHWLVTAREPDDDGYLPDGPDACFDTADAALDHLAARLTRTQHQLACETDDDIETTAVLDHAIQDLLDGDLDLDQDGYACTVAVDPQLPVTYRITRILRSDCDATNHS